MIGEYLIELQHQLFEIVFDVLNLITFEFVNEFWFVAECLSHFSLFQYMHTQMIQSALCGTSFPSAVFLVYVKYPDAQTTALFFIFLWRVSYCLSIICASHDYCCNIMYDYVTEVESLYFRYRWHVELFNLIGWCCMMCFLINGLWWFMCLKQTWFFLLIQLFFQIFGLINKLRLKGNHLLSVNAF